MATQALYRQWRPATFSDFVGQEAIVTTLRNQVVSGRITHAYLFCGSRGTGKTTAAKILARSVNCETPVSGEACGHCAVCDALSAENCLDIVEIDAASNNGVDEIRDLREKVKYPPQHGKYRVYIIDEVHMLSTGAFNALLKTLEEPPPHALFILATTEPQRLPATILSRCQRYDFRRFPAEQIAGRLRHIVEGEHSHAEPEALSLIAHAAEGGMRDAISLLDMCLSYGGGSVDAALVREVLGASDRGFLFQFAGRLIAGDAAGALLGIDELMRSGREPQVFAKDITTHLRALMLSQTLPQDKLSQLLEITLEDAQRFIKQGAEVSRERLLALLDLFMNTDTDMRWAAQPRVALEVSAVRACLPEDALRLDALAARVDLVEKKIQNGVVAAPAAAAVQSQSADAALTAKRPAAPAQQQKTVPAPASASSQAIWDGVIKILRDSSMMLYSQVRMGRFLGIDGDAARIAFKKENEIFLNVLRKEDNAQIITAALTEAAGRPMRFLPEMEGAPAQDTAKQKDTLQAVFDMFGRDKVEVVDED